jgi:hypothetical protein
MGPLLNVPFLVFVRKTRCWLAVALILDLPAVAKRMCGSLMCGMAWNLL